MLLRAGARRATAVRVRRDRPARAARAASARAACERLYAQRARWRVARSSPTASTRRTILERWLARARRRTCPVEFVPFGVDVEAFRPTTRHPTWTSSRSEPIRTATSSSCSAVARALPDDALPRSSRRPSARARSAALPANVSVESRPAVRRDAPPARAGAGRRAARAREQLLRRDDGPPPGDGARRSRSS